jgi:hypothetical protein
MRPHDHKGLLHRGRDQHRHPEAARLDGSTILVDLRDTDGAAGLKISAPKATTHNPAMDLADGSFEEFVLGSATEEERARMLNRLHEIVTSRMH